MPLNANTTKKATTLNGVIKTKKTPMSRLKKSYIARFVGRIAIFIASVVLFFAYPEQFDVLDGMNFFKSFSLFHILWVIWLFDMICQLIPIKNYIPLGSQKLFSQHFAPIKEKINYAALKKYVHFMAVGAGKIIALWVLLIGAIAVCYYTKIITKEILFLISIAFYVFDLVCVLIWCPFRLILKTRCCTTCRIFNWDHMMMFSPIIFMGGFYAISLFLVAMVVLLVWEISVLMHPERFWENTNDALKCANCTDKLCNQYCRKLR